ncbi:MAG: Hedgehog/intein hint domain protein, partial [Anaerocolumna sp.]|nr:Hedgehog/intein hint domain protein [Anaerocolumna sp.]
GMVLEAGVTQVIVGYKSLKNGFSSGESVVTGSGVGNAKKVEGSAGKGVGEAPDYIKDNRVPLDKETILSSKDYSKTNIKYKGAQVYKNGDKYYYRDTFHTGEAAHLEVFDKRGNHIGEANPQTGELMPGTADPTKKINVK